MHNKYLEKIAGMPIANATAAQIASGIIGKGSKIKDVAKLKHFASKTQNMGNSMKVTSPSKFGLVRDKVYNSDMAKKIRELQS